MDKFVPFRFMQEALAKKRAEKYVDGLEDPFDEPEHEVFLKFVKDFPLRHSSMTETFQMHLAEWTAREPAKILRAETDRRIESVAHDVQVEVERISRNAQTRYDQALQDLEDKHRNQLHKKEQEFSRELDQAIARVGFNKDCLLKSEIARYEKAIADSQQALNNQKQRSEQELRAAEKQKNHEIDEKERFINQLKRDLQDNQTAHMTKFENLRKQSDQYQERLIVDHRQTLAMVNESNASELAKQAGKYEQVLAASKESLEDFKRKASKDMRIAREQHANELSSKSQGYTEAIRMLKSSHTEEEQLLQKKHEQETLRLKQHVQQLGDAIVAKDDKVYQGALFVVLEAQKTDRQLEESFTEVQKLIEVLSGSDWIQDTKLWPEKPLRSASDKYGKRALKKAILKNTIWVLLYRYIFASPFRVFGDEGLKLETEWFEKCGEDSSPENVTVYVWPHPTVQAERWRYMTIKECQEALRAPVPSEFDPRARLRKGFIETRNQLVNKLKVELVQVVNEETLDVGKLNSLATRAASTWLEFGRHCCRVVIQLLSSPEASLSQNLAQISDGIATTMTVLPVLGRHGNAKGVDMEKFSKIGDCKGESIEIP